MKTFIKVCLGVLSGFLAMVIIIQVIVIASSNAGDESIDISFKDNKIYIIRVEGPIFTSKPIIDKMERFRRNKFAKALVLRIDSPGGAVGSSQEIFDEIIELRKKKKIVIASMGNLAASGGYYIASPCDRIVSNPGTLTGSIGVIISSFNIKKLAEKFGVDLYVIKSGKYKDILNAFRDMTPEETKILQDSIDDTYEQFIDAILKGRKHLIAERIIGKKYNDKLYGRIREIVKSKADGRVFSGKQAYEYGFVDKLGGLSEAIKLAASFAEIKGEPVLIEEKDKLPLWGDIFSGLLKPVNNNLLKLRPGLFYLMP